MYQDDINYERLREDLFRESMGAAFGGGFGGAFIQAEEIKKASESELLEIAADNGMDVKSYVF